MLRPPRSTGIRCPYSGQPPSLEASKNGHGRELPVFAVPTGGLQLVGKALRRANKAQ